MTETPPAMPQDQLITFLYTDDFEAMEAFYREVMGLTPVLGQRTEKGSVAIFRVNAGAFLGVSDFAHRPRGTDGIMITFIRDVDAEYARLSGLGVEFEGPPAWLIGDTVYAAFFRDPQGYRLEIQSFNDPRWDAAIAP
ncbi:MAG: VOC family protein [Pseudomonadota bacterium]